MTRPECPNCLRPRADGPDWSKAADEVRHLCFGRGESTCMPPIDLRPSTAEIRDLRAGFAAMWSEVARLRVSVEQVADLCDATTDRAMSAETAQFAAEEAAARLTRERDEAQAALASVRDTPFTFIVHKGYDGKARALMVTRNEETGSFRIGGPKAGPWTPERKFRVDGATLLRGLEVEGAGRALLDRLEKAERELGDARSERDGLIQRLLELEGPDANTILEDTRIARDNAIARADKAEADLQAMRAERDAVLVMVPPYAAAEARANNAEADLQRERERADRLLATLRETGVMLDEMHDAGLIVIDSEQEPVRSIRAALGKDPAHEPG